MTGQPDIAAVLAWAARVVRDTEYLGAALRGEPTPAVDITSTPALAEDEVHPRLCSLPHGHAGGHWWDESKAADLAKAEADPADPYGSSKHGRFDAASEPAWCEQRGPDWRFICALAAGHGGYHEAQGASPLPVWLDGDTGYTYPEDGAGSAAGVAEGVDLCPARERAGWRCIRAAGHEGPHEADGQTMANPLITWEDPLTDPWMCPAQWGEPPETMLCSLASGHDGCHATAEGIEWGGRWETAEPKDGAR